MAIIEFKKALLATIAAHFPAASVEILERRTTILQARVSIDEETFIEVYFNSLTGKKSYSLIFRGQRVMGYDNYKFWHYHPFDKPEEHIPCEEPDVEDVIAEMKAIVKRLGAAKS
ncbi:MAG: hypothetical protein U9R11_04800 [Chloroflexota bacterium]|nr:hypothetical protein [Chloroflexota bacterium]